MAQQGYWDVGCGIYSWNINVPPSPSPTAVPTKTPLTIGPQSCFQVSNFPTKPNLYTWDVARYGIVACGSLPTSMGPGSALWSQTYPATPGYTDLEYKLSWKGGCVADTSDGTQNPQQPLGASASNACYLLFTGDYRNCRLPFLYRRRSN